MKTFIKNKLRIVLEGKKTTHSPSNPVSHTDQKVNTQNDLIRITHKIVSLNNQYGQDSYFQNTHEGDGIYFATIHTNGNVTIKTPNSKRKIVDSDIGLISPSTNGTQSVLIKAYRGIEHQELQNDRTGNVRTNSPANDAAIKTYLIFAKDILEFVKQNMTGESQYTSDNKNFKSQTDDKWKYKYEKKQKELNRNKPNLSMDSDEAAEYEKKQMHLQNKIARMKKRRGL